MKKEKFEKFLTQWGEKHSINGSNLTAPDCVSIEEIYRGRAFNLNRSCYQVTITADNSSSGNVEALVYSNLDLLELDKDGDVVSAETIDYLIIKE